MFTDYKTYTKWEYSAGGKGIDLEGYSEESNKEFWDHIIRNPDGSLNENQIYLELSDFSMIVNEVPQVYSELTNNNLSKPNYLASAILGEIHRVQDKEYADWYKDKIIEIVDTIFEGDKEILEKMLAIAGIE